ncbi:hypothetical protein [Pseudomonas aeruginosa]|uniref:hypothetical protein n=1 Tax=Pseudomonas aeruginosa TaxID=287 RepID=UPI002A09A669|nr:hypothetical protein [Pseudomonas aeruginosa]
MNASISVRDFHFLAAYTAVNEGQDWATYLGHFLAAYTAVNHVWLTLFEQQLFLAAYTAVN